MRRKGQDLDGRGALKAGAETALDIDGQGVVYQIQEKEDIGRRKNQLKEYKEKRN